MHTMQKLAQGSSPNSSRDMEGLVLVSYLPVTSSPPSLALSSSPRSSSSLPPLFPEHLFCAGHITLFNTQSKLVWKNCPPFSECYKWGSECRYFSYMQKKKKIRIWIHTGWLQFLKFSLWFTWSFKANVQMELPQSFMIVRYHLQNSCPSFFSDIKSH